MAKKKKKKKKEKKRKRRKKASNIKKLCSFTKLFKHKRY
jgi:hypothetical protein